MARSLHVETGLFKVNILRRTNMLFTHEMIIFNVFGCRKYCRYTKSPLVITPLKEIWESPWVNENLTPVGFEPTISRLDLPIHFLFHGCYAVPILCCLPTFTARGSRGNKIKFIMLHWINE